MASANGATIEAGTGLATVINVFEVEPDRQAELAGFLSAATETVIRHLPGFISVSIHKSLDGTRVVNYAQWASREDVENALGNPDAKAQMKQAAALAKSIAPAVYRVEAVHRR